jgi:hypothetical protein
MDITVGGQTCCGHADRTGSGRFADKGLLDRARLDIRIDEAGLVGFQLKVISQIEIVMVVFLVTCIHKI